MPMMNFMFFSFIDSVIHSRKTTFKNVVREIALMFTLF